MAEYLAVKEANLCLLPDGVSYEAAAMNEPAAVALHAFRKSRAVLGDTMVIYGIGTIAFLLAWWAKAAGVSNIILAGRLQQGQDGRQAGRYPCQAVDTPGGQSGAS